MKSIGLIVALLGLAGFAVAITVNPASNVTADSNNTAQTIVLRDASGNFSAGSITASSIQNSGQTVLQVQTTTQLSVLVPLSTGAIVSVQFFTAGALGSAFGNCISSGIAAGAWVYPSTSTASPARACN